MVSGFCKIFSSRSGETVHQTPKVLEMQENVLEVLYHDVKFGGAGISPAPARNSQKR